MQSLRSELKHAVSPPPVPDVLLLAVKFSLLAVSLSPLPVLVLLLAGRSSALSDVSGSLLGP